MATKATLYIEPLQGLSGGKYIIFKGQIDESNLEQIKEQVDPIIEEPDLRFMIFNFKDLEFINSRVIGYLLVLFTQMTEKEHQLMIVEANENIMEILNLVGLTSLIGHYSTLAEAIELIRAG